MTDQTCAFCLGGCTEIPPFGTIKDAQDLLSPCSTCSLVTHRKCLVDWFYTLPVNKVSHDFEPDEEDLQEAEETGGPQNPEETFMGMSFRSRWFTVLGSYISSTSGSSNRGDNENDNDNNNDNDNDNGNGSDIDNGITTENHVLHNEHREERNSDDWLSLSASCPQCKEKITFQIQGSKALAVNFRLKSILGDTLQYSGIFLGLSGVATGIVTMGYVGLARCGVSIIDALVPVSLISPLFQKKTHSQSLSALLSAEKPFNLANQLKFQNIPLLPVMLYRMRYSSLVDCLFKSRPRTSITDWIGELVVCNYVSSLGNHTLVKQVYKNMQQIFLLLRAKKFALLSVGLLFKNIDWWDPAVMIGATIPARWIYDLVYRFTINKVHFNMNTSIRPRDIANTLNPVDLARLETLDTQLVGLKYCISQRFQHALHTNGKRRFQGILGVVKEVARVLRDGTIQKLVRLKMLQFFHESKACLRKDYSSSMLSKSATVMAVTTILWPFVAADLGKLIYAIFISKIPSLISVEKDKLMFFSNLLGMAFVAFLKDFANLYLCYQKANQLSNIIVVTQKDLPLSTVATPLSQVHRFPGSYEN